ncbi:DUF2799 domain-containing protein [Aliikangiella coralliicola]|uniref:DUF2799 domain-containing protein n=1 Tax=Aliikangiella coralliicola TaxID=2592383 RepID=A0A545TWA8_9GAMM|nr:DUF2799 domain-containing protein [Aliikangiella coralliicola]TQV81508.1 DUF2799 domain-containing protein [Aliikangiella coralliicola]
MYRSFGVLITLIFVCLLAFLTGCATLNQSECQVANWEIIGLEDGSAGRPSSYVGQHRSACAEYGIVPDLDKYLLGHKKGLRQFCTYQNGFNLGNQGRSFSNVCPQELAGEFRRGFDRGYQFYGLRSEIGQLKSSIASHHDRLHHISTKIQRHEDTIIAGNTSVESRRRLLNEIEELRHEQDDIEHELPQLERRLFELEDQYERLNQ